MPSNWQLATILIATAGAAFGAVNAYLNWKTRRRKLRIELLLAGSAASDGLFLIRVQNLGAPTTVKDIHLTTSSKRFAGSWATDFAERALGHMEVIGHHYPARDLGHLRAHAGLKGTLKIRARALDNTSLMAKSNGVNFTI
jgi:hypothetical protein